MTDEHAADLFRQVLRSELEPLLARIDRLAEEARHDVPPSWRVAVDTWLAARPIGTTGSASGLLPGFLATQPPPPISQPWTPVAFGRALAGLRDRFIQGRVLRRRADRKGVYVYTVEAVPVP